MQPEHKAKLARQTAVVAAVFIGLVSLLMMLNYMQIRSSDPLESQALKTLVERLSAEPGNQELTEEIRQLDLLVRKAYFNSIWQIKTGAWLLVVAAFVLVISLRTYLNVSFSISQPSPDSFRARFSRKITQRWIGAAGLAVLALAGLSAILSIDHLARFETGQTVAAIPQDAADIIRYEMQTGGEGNTDGPERHNDSTAIAWEEASDVSLEGMPDSTGAAISPEHAGAANSQTAAVLTAETITQHHNSFRGAWGQGISMRRNIPTNWDGATGRQILWKTALPLHGYNSPVIWGDKIFMSAASTAKRVVLCLDRQTGRILWEREVTDIPGSPATPPKTTDDTGLAAPTVTTDGRYVFAIFGTGDVIAFDFQGNRIWARNLGVPRNHYGHASSLLTWDGKVFVQYDTQAGSRVLALNSQTGQTVWETQRTDGVSWASPILIRVDNAYRLVLSATPGVSAYDIATGKELWKVDVMSGEVGPSPAFGGGMVFAANEYAKMAAINAQNGTVVWEDNYYLPEVSSPLYHNGLLYIATSYAVFACFDASTGEFLWEYDAENGFYSSPVFVDGKVLIFDIEGQAYFFGPGREVNLIASPKLGERVFATPVFTDGRLYVRGNRHMYCIGE